MDDRWSELPLFPLSTVLFPGMVLPLHIFEERYRLMINRCLEEHRPFGVLLIREGLEVGESANPYEVGTTAVIGGVSRTEDGRMNIITIGGERFRLQGMSHDLPYLVGKAEPWPLAGAETEEALERVRPVHALFKRYTTLLAQAQGEAMQVEKMPTEPRTLALLVAIALQLPMVQKQHLLDQPAIADMLEAERQILRRENSLMAMIVRTQEQQSGEGYSGYLATN